MMGDFLKKGVKGINNVQLWLFWNEKMLRNYSYVVVLEAMEKSRCEMLETDLQPI